MLGLTPQAPPADLIAVGRLHAPHGLQGWLKCRAYSDDLANLLSIPHWWVCHHRDYYRLAVAEIRPNSQPMLVRFAPCQSREEAAFLVNHTIYLPRAQWALPTGESYYWVDLVGCRVVDAKRKDLGEVISLYDTPAHDVLVLDKGLDIPFVMGESIAHVDVVARTITLHWNMD